jgi:hypothetical protein
VRLKSFSAFALAAGLAVSSASCGEFVRDQGRSPSQLVITSLVGVPGDSPSQKGNTFISDVLSQVTKPEPACSTDEPCPTTINDLGEATFTFILKDSGVAGDSAPTPVNAITLNRYHVEFKRSDGRNAQGVDVPYAFDSAFTVTVPLNGTTSATFDLVRHNAKHERPLVGLVCAATCPPMISTIAEITFYGRDQAGNDVSAVGTIGVTFGDVIRGE